jgi:hypothetical protein
MESLSHFCKRQIRRLDCVDSVWCEKVDYGTTNPMVFHDIYDDGQLFWVIREYYSDSRLEMRQKTDAEYEEDLVNFIGPHNDAKVIMDASAASFRAEMMKRGIWNVEADDDVSEGIRISSIVLNKAWYVSAARMWQRQFRKCRPTPGIRKRHNAGKRKPSECMITVRTHSATSQRPKARIGGSPFNEVSNFATGA